MSKTIGGLISPFKECILEALIKVVSPIFLMP